MKNNLFNFTIFFPIFFGLSLNYVFAQYPGMGSFRTQQSQNFINQQTTNNLAILNHSRYIGNQELTYHIQLKDSVFKDFSSLMYYDTITHKSFLIFENKKFRKSDTLHRYEKIYPENTIKVSSPYSFMKFGNSIDVLIDGIPNDTCWVFKVLGGSISLYGKTMDYLSYENSPLYGMGAEIVPSTIVGIQLNDGPILVYNTENLRKFLEGNQDALRFLNKKKYFKAINKYNRDKEKELN